VIQQDARETEIPIAEISGSKFAVIVTDVRKKKLRISFEFRKAAPKVPDKVKARENRGEVAATWLAGQQNGAWRIEALRKLRALPEDEATTELIAALEKGWLPR